MLAAEVMFPGDLPDDPVEMMRGFRPHRVPEANLVIDGDAAAIARMEMALGIADVLDGKSWVVQPVAEASPTPRRSKSAAATIGFAQVEADKVMETVS
jgi:hypothetical protein